MEPSNRKKRFSIIDFISIPGGLVILIVIIRLLYRYFVYDSFSLF